jgi:hypothetical protein
VVDKRRQALDLRDIEYGDEAIHVLHRDTLRPNGTFWRCGRDHVEMPVGAASDQHVLLVCLDGAHSRHGRNA